MSSLVHKKCLPCELGSPKLARESAEELLKQRDGWKIERDFSPESIEKLTKTLKFKNFKEAISFINKLAELAEQEGHHPDFKLFGWNKVLIEIYTHASKGLTENDFIVAAKINQIA